MFNLKVLDKYTNAKETLNSIEVVRNFYKDMWSEADERKDNDAMDEIDTHLAELDVMQVELERTLKGYKEYLQQ